MSRSADSSPDVDNRVAEEVDFVGHEKKISE
jgi:hypothetical protein